MTKEWVQDAGAGYAPPASAVETLQLVRPSEIPLPDNNNNVDMFRLYSKMINFSTAAALESSRIRVSGASTINTQLLQFSAAASVDSLSKEFLEHSLPTCSSSSSVAAAVES